MIPVLITKLLAIKLVMYSIDQFGDRTYSQNSFSHFANCKIVIKKKQLTTPPQKS